MPTKVRLSNDPLAYRCAVADRKREDAVKQVWEKWRGKEVLLGQSMMRNENRMWGRAFGCDSDVLWIVETLGIVSDLAPGFTRQASAYGMDVHVLVCRHMIQAGE